MEKYMEERKAVAEKIMRNRKHSMGAWAEGDSGKLKAQCSECGMNLIVSSKEDEGAPIQGWAPELNCGMPFGPGAKQSRFGLR